MKFQYSAIFWLHLKLEDTSEAGRFLQTGTLKLLKHHSVLMHFPGSMNPYHLQLGSTPDLLLGHVRWPHHTHLGWCKSPGSENLRDFQHISNGSEPSFSAFQWPFQGPISRIFPFPPIEKIVGPTPGWNPMNLGPPAANLAWELWTLQGPGIDWNPRYKPLLCWPHWYDIYRWQGVLVFDQASENQNWLIKWKSKEESGDMIIFQTPETNQIWDDYIMISCHAALVVMLLWSWYLCSK